MDKFLSIHIPKTGGTTFLRWILRDLWPNAVHQDYKSEVYKTIDPRWKVIHGHFKPSKYADLGWSMIVWVRHPWQRILSEYAYLIRQGERRDSDYIKGSFSSFVKKKQNFMSQYIEYMPLENFAFVGVLELFNESLTRFGETFNVDVRKYQSASFRRRLDDSYDKNADDKYEPSLSEFEGFLELNRDDYKLYSDALLLYDYEEEWE